MEQVEGNIKADDFLNRYLVSLMRGNSKDYHTEWLRFRVLPT